MAIEDAKWYIIHTYSGYESMVKDSLEKLIENNNLQENIYDIQIPTVETLEEKANGKKKLVERKKFPSYVFVKMIYSNQIWYYVTNTRGVTGFVGPQGRPTPLTEEEVMRLGLVTSVTSIDYTVGDTVLIMAGALESFTGTIVELNEATQKAKVKVEMFGRTTDVDLDFVQIKKVETKPAEEATEDNQE